MLKIIFSALVVYLLLCACAYLFQRRLIFMPTSGSVPEPKALSLRAERVRIPVSDDVTLTGWWAGSGASPYTLIWCHGNAGNISHRAEELRDFMRDGLNVLLFDYRGYGESTGSPTALGIKEDALAAYDFLRSRGVEADRIVPYGRSIGSGAAAHLANERDVAGLILVQPFTSTADMGRHAYPFLPVKLLLKENLDNVAELTRYEGPLLVLHGDADDIIPYAMGKRLFDSAASEKKTMVTLEGGDHNSIGFTHSNRILDSIAEWLDGLTP
jgi:fermentation-respiration switch protein FrsA (DUF1100 family)